MRRLTQPAARSLPRDGWRELAAARKGTVDALRYGHILQKRGSEADACGHLSELAGNLAPMPAFPDA